MKEKIISILLFIVLITVPFLSQNLIDNKEGTEEDIIDDPTIDFAEEIELPTDRGTRGVYDDWTYEKQINITENSGNDLTNYQVKIEIQGYNDTWGNYTDFGKINANGTDIRFVNYDKSVSLDYWIESWNDTSTNATLWIEVLNLTGSSTTVIFMYYGNPSATNESNGANTFAIFDDFSGYNGELWKSTLGSATPIKAYFPIIVNKTIVIGGVGFISRIYADNGTHMWDIDIGSRIGGAGMILEDNILYNYNSESGLPNMTAYYWNNQTVKWDMPLGHDLGARSPDHGMTYQVKLIDGKLHICDPEGYFLVYANNGTNFWNVTNGMQGSVAYNAIENVTYTQCVVDYRIYKWNLSDMSYIQSDALDSTGKYDAPVYIEKLSGDILLVGTELGFLYCMWANNLTIKWSWQIDDYPGITRYGGTYDPIHDWCFVVSGSPENRLYKINVSDGQTLARFDGIDIGFSKPAIYNNQVLIVHSKSGNDNTGYLVLNLTDFEVYINHTFPDDYEQPCVVPFIYNGSIVWYSYWYPTLSLYQFDSNANNTSDLNYLTDYNTRPFFSNSTSNYIRGNFTTGYINGSNFHVTTGYYDNSDGAMNQTSDDGVVHYVDLAFESSGNFTVEYDMWMYEIANSYIIFYLRRIDSNNFVSTQAIFSTNKVQVVNRSDGSSTTYEVSHTLNLNTLYNLETVYNGSVIEQYMDGVSIHKKDLVETVSGDISMMCIGSDAGGKGYIDNFKIRNYQYPEPTLSYGQEQLQNFNITLLRDANNITTTLFQFEDSQVGDSYVNSTSYYYCDNSTSYWWNFTDLNYTTYNISSSSNLKAFIFNNLSNAIAFTNIVTTGIADNYGNCTVSNLSLSQSYFMRAEITSISSSLITGNYTGTVQHFTGIDNTSIEITEIPELDRTYDLILYEGWNLVSIPFIINQTIAWLLSNDNVTTITTRNLTIYDTFTKSFTTTSLLQPGFGYYIFALNETVINLTETWRKTLTINLTSGFNLIGVSYEKDGYWNTQTLLNHLGGNTTTKRDRYGVYTTYVMGKEMESYQILRGVGYYVYVDIAKTVTL